MRPCLSPISLASAFGAREKREASPPLALVWLCVRGFVWLLGFCLFVCLFVCLCAAQPRHEARRTACAGGAPSGRMYAPAGSPFCCTCGDTTGHAPAAAPRKRSERARAQTNTRTGRRQRQRPAGGPARALLRPFSQPALRAWSGATDARSGRGSAFLARPSPCRCLYRRARRGLRGVGFGVARRPCRRRVARIRGGALGARPARAAAEPRRASACAPHWCCAVHARNASRPICLMLITSPR